VGKTPRLSGRGWRPASACGGIRILASGRCLTVANAADRPRTPAVPGGMSPGSENGPRENWRGRALLETDASRDRPVRRAPRRRTEPGVSPERALEGTKPRRAPTRWSSPRPGWRSTRERTFRGEQSFEAGVPAANGRARRARERRSESARFAARTADRLSGREEPSSRPLRPASLRGRAAAKGRQDGESDRENTRARRATQRSTANPQGSKGRAKARHGSSVGRKL